MENGCFLLLCWTVFFYYFFASCGNRLGPFRARSLWFDGARNISILTVGEIGEWKEFKQHLFIRGQND